MPEWHFHSSQARYTRAENLHLSGKPGGRRNSGCLALEASRIQGKELLAGWPSYLRDDTNQYLRLAGGRSLLLPAISEIQQTAKVLLLCLPLPAESYGKALCPQ